jgi:hypothetical protein
MLSEISEGRRLNRLRKFTDQGTSSDIHSEVFLGNMRCFWDSVIKSYDKSSYLSIFEN